MSARLPGVRRIAVLRPSALGDFVFALPALVALKAAYPEATLTLLGRAWHARFLHGRPGPVDEVVEVPVLRGVGAPEDAAEDASAVCAFLAGMRDRRFDLALQMYGGGRWSNPLVAALGARVGAGLRAGDAPPLDLTLDYAPLHNERARLLELVALVGAPVVTLDPRLAVTAADRAELDGLGLDDADAPLVVLQPGATDPRRRWPARKFAAVGDAFAARGARVAINGSADEAGVVADVLRSMRRGATDLTGRLSIGGLAALLERARLLVSNDTGPLHLAQAVGCRTVGLYWFSNLFASAPLAFAGHRHALALRLACPVCGTDNLWTRCAHDPSFLDEIEVDEVLRLAETL